MTTTDVFSVPVFFVVFRETIEAAIIVSLLLAFLKQTLGGPNRDETARKALVKQVWIGSALGFLLCLVIGAAIIGTFYRVGTNVWQSAEPYYEGTFYLVACLIISVTGAALLRLGKMQEKWRLKVAKAMTTPSEAEGKRRFFGLSSGKYALFLIAFITVFREGIEGIVFVAGVSFSAPATSVPLPVIVGLIAGCLVGWALYCGASLAKLQLFLVVSTCLMYLVAAGLLARSVSYFEQGHWNKVVGQDVAELGDGPGSYDIDRSVWHVNCCSPEFNGGGAWGIFNGILGWTNSATYSTVIAYNTYWLVVMVSLIAMRYREVKGHWPLVSSKKPVHSVSSTPAAETGAA